MRYRDIALWIFFIACLVPITIAPYGVNYLFVLYPLAKWLAGARWRMPEKLVLVALGWFSIALLASLALRAGDMHMMARTAISFGLFASVFALAFQEISARETRLFKLAIVAAAVAFSTHAMITYFASGGGALGFAQKDIVGSQRYGFVYLFALAVVAFDDFAPGVARAAQAVAVPILLAGLLLTFSRSSIVAFGGAAMCYLLFAVSRKGLSRRLELRRLYRLAIVGCGALLLLAIMLPYPFVFYYHHLIERYFTVVTFEVAQSAGLSASPTMQTQQEVVQDVFNPVGSEGTRVVLWRLVLDYIQAHPVFGSGYLGIWTLPSSPSGSAHNQYMDVLFRTGLPGLALYLALLVKIAVVAFRRDSAIFWGLVGALFYGVFHETFKEPQGAFLLSFCLAFSAGIGRSADQIPAQASGEVRRPPYGRT